MNKWSYSSMSLFQQCPKKYYHLRIAKDVVDPPSHQMRYGLDVHQAAEHYVRDGTPIPEKYSYLTPMLDSLKKIKGDIYCEYRMGLTRDLEPCKFGAKDAWWRGIADFLVVNDDRAKVVDYKTGQNKYADTKQLELLALATFKHFPEVTVVNAGLLFVVHAAFIKEHYYYKQQDELWEKWREQTAELDSAYENNVWNPKQNFTCRAWCPITNCIHNGREE